MRTSTMFNQTWQVGTADQSYLQTVAEDHNFEMMVTASAGRGENAACAVHTQMESFLSGYSVVPAISSLLIKLSLLL